jgi:hypothetical protein
VCTGNRKETRIRVLTERYEEYQELIAGLYEHAALPCLGGPAACGALLSRVVAESAGGLVGMGMWISRLR